MSNLEDMKKSIARKRLTNMGIQLIPFFLSWIFFFFFFEVFDFKILFFFSLIVLIGIVTIFYLMGLYVTDFRMTDEELDFLNDWKAFEKVKLKEFEKWRKENRS